MADAVVARTDLEARREAESELTASLATSGVRVWQPDQAAANIKATGGSLAGKEDACAFSDKRSRFGNG